MCCWFHSFTLFTGTATRTTLWHALPFGIYGNICTCHVNHVIRIYTMFHKKTTRYLIAHNFGKC